MSARRSFLDWLRGRPDPEGSDSKAGADLERGAPVPGPLPPTRMVVSGELPFGEHDRAVAEGPTRFVLDPRWRLWRDTSAVLVVLALVIAFSDWLPRPEQSVLSETDAPTQTSGAPTPGESVAPTATLATPGPTREPSAAPPPTARPTARPTPQPTATPTASSSATPGPSASAEPLPTEFPTTSPSESPTSSPSESPTSSPSESPTTSPP
jgi:hypothetical protein